MQTITIGNQKGGVGKTTTAHALASGLSMKGFKTLAVDLDPQTNFTYSAAVDTSTGNDIHSLFNKKSNVADCIQVTPDGFYMIPGSTNMAGADMEYTGSGSQLILKGILDPLKDRFDYCIIDTPPTLGILTINALSASERLVIPMTADVYSIQGLSQLWSLIQDVKAYCNNELKIDGLLVTKYNRRSIINRQINDSLNDIAEDLQTRVYDTHIREGVAIKEAQFTQQSILSYNKKSKVSADYWEFINEFLNIKR